MSAKPANILFHETTPWRKETRNAWTLYSAGFMKNANKILEHLQTNTPDSATLNALLKNEPLQFGIMIEGPKALFAATDRTRSFPIFYSPDQKTITNHAQKITPTCTTPDKTALLEFCMAGYTIGNKTLNPNLKQLQGAEYLLNTQPAHHYTVYTPAPQKITVKAALKTLGDTLDTAIKDTLNIIGDTPIWVPLSGGMDSRLILAKLHEHGAKNLQSFSYGLKNNDEAKIARTVAAQLGVPWHMIPARPQNARALYNSAERQHYETLAHGFCTIPSYVEFEAIHALKQSGLASPGDFIINGQTGDFLSGGHIPALLYENTTATKQDMITYIIDKHFSLWTHLKTSENIALLEHSITENLLNHNTLITQYESFEWAERQCKMVVQSQRVYNFFDYQWILPLWHSDLINFFETLPFDLKYQQNLFLKYLKSWNYKDVFNIPRAEIKTWKPHQTWRIAAAKFLEITQGSAAKENFYKKNLYHGHAHNQYALFGKTLYDAHYQNIRNMVSLSILDFCTHHDLPFPAGEND